jgi:hypothetical protein
MQKHHKNNFEDFRSSFHLSSILVPLYFREGDVVRWGSMDSEDCAASNDRLHIYKLAMDIYVYSFAM